MGNSRLEQEVVTEGYLHVKYPPGTSARKLGKAWQRKWIVVSKRESEVGAVSLHLYASKVLECAPCGSCQCFALGRDSVLFRSHSRSHPRRAFGIASVESGTKLNALLYFAAESEDQAEVWMKAVRDAILPPSPLVQLEGVWQERHYVSLIDSERAFRYGLFAAYGHLLADGDHLAIVHPNTGKASARWPLQTVQDFQMVRSDRENETSGVFSVLIQPGCRGSPELQQLSFYSPTAVAAVRDFGEVLRSGPKIRLRFSENRTLPHTREWQALHSCQLGEGDTTMVEPSTFQHSGDGGVLGPRLKRFSALPSSLLNTSITSRSSTYDLFEANNSDESEYTPPMTPYLLRRELRPQTDDMDSSPEDLMLCDAEFQDSEVFQSNKKDHDSALHSVRSKEQPVYENTGCYGTVCNPASVQHAGEIATTRTYDLFQDTALPIVNVSESCCENVYCEIPTYQLCRTTSVGGETVYEEFDDEEEVRNDIYVPPLPPPRKARRPTTLRLEELSCSIENTLSNLQTEKPRSWFSTIRGIGKILGRKSRSANPSPTSECTPKDANIPDMRRNESDPAFVPKGDTSETLVELPIPFPPLNLMHFETDEKETSCQKLESHKSRIPGTRSLDNLPVDDPHSRPVCLKHLLLSFKEPGTTCNCCVAQPKNMDFSLLHDPLRRRQSKSLSTDIMKHLRSIRPEFQESSDHESASRQTSDEYCPMAPIRTRGNSENSSEPPCQG